MQPSRKLAGGISLNTYTLGVSCKPKKSRKQKLRKRFMRHSRNINYVSSTAITPVANTSAGIFSIVEIWWFVQFQTSLFSELAASFVTPDFLLLKRTAEASVLSSPACSYMYILNRWVATKEWKWEHLE